VTLVINGLSLQLNTGIKKQIILHIRLTSWEAMMKNPTKKLLNLTRRYNKVTKEYRDTMHAYVQECLPMGSDPFWEYIDQLAQEIEERLPYTGNPIKSGVHNTFLKIMKVDNADTPLNAWVRCAYFASAYRALVAKLYSKCFEMPGVGKGDDSYGDWVDALPLAGESVITRILSGELDKYEAVYDAVSHKRCALLELIMEGENYVQSELDKKLVKRFASAVASEDTIKKSEDMIATWI